MISPFDPVRPGGQLSASDLNRAFAEIERLARLTVAPPLELVKDAGGFKLRYAGAETFTAELLDKSDGGSGSGSGCDPSHIRYAWRKLVDAADRCPDFIPDPNGLAGTLDDFPAFELNDSGVPLETNGHPTRVRMWPGVAGDVFFFEVIGELADSGSGSGPSNVWTVPVESCDQATGVITTTTYRITFPRGTVVERVV